MAEPKKWNEVLYRFYCNITFYKGKMILPFLAILLIGYIFVYRPLRDKWIEQGTGQLNKISAIDIQEIPDIKTALDLGLNNFTYTVNPETGESKLIASGGKFKSADDKSKLKFVGAIAFEGMDVGGAYEMGSMAGFNFDCPILLTRSFGAGVSKDFTDNFFAGGGAFVPYDVKDAEDAKDRTELKIYGGWRF